MEKNRVCIKIPLSVKEDNPNIIENLLSEIEPYSFSEKPSHKTADESDSFINFYTKTPFKKIQEIIIKLHPQITASINNFAQI